MSGESTHGVGSALCAKADVVSTLSAAAIKNVLVENFVIPRAPRHRSEKSANVLNKSRTLSSRQYDELFGAAQGRATSRFRAPGPRDYLAVSVYNLCFQIRHRNDSDEPRHEDLSGRRVGIRDAGFVCPCRRVHAQPQSENCLQPRFKRRKTQYRD